jgi:hypothetical protein
MEENRMMCWLFICGVACGVTTWLFGFGGGFVTVPLISSGDRGVGRAERCRRAGDAYCGGHLCAGDALRGAAGNLASSSQWNAVLASSADDVRGHCPRGIAGALLALSANGRWIRWLFVSYLLVTILDCYFRPGFMALASDVLRRLPRAS